MLQPISFFQNLKILKWNEKKLRILRFLNETSILNEQTIEKGLNSFIKDFEDAVQYFSASE